MVVKGGDELVGPLQVHTHTCTHNTHTTPTGTCNPLEGVNASQCQLHMLHLSCVCVCVNVCAVEVAATCSDAVKDDAGNGGQVHSGELQTAVYAHHLT